MSKSRNDLPAYNYEQYTAIIEEKRGASLANAKETIKNTSEKRKYRQEQFNISKESALKRIAELETLVQKLHADLKLKLSTLSKELTVEQAVKAVKQEFDEFKKLSNELYDLKTLLGKSSNFEYNILLINLASDVNSEFLFYVDYTKSLIPGISSSSISALSNEKKKKLQQIIEESGLFSGKLNKTILNIMKHFPDHINKLTDINDVCYSLIIDPSIFENVHPHVKRYLLEHTSYLKKIIYSNSNILLYLPNEYLDNLATQNPNYIGKMIVDNPDVLLQFYPAFFDERHHQKDMKYFFTSVKKKDIIEAIKPYLWKFPELADYFKLDLQANQELGV